MLEEFYEDKEVLIIEQPKSNLYSPEIVEQVEITEEMREYSKIRTLGHIARVVALGEKLGFNFDQHDHTKFSPELEEQYILIDNSYRKDLDSPIPYTKDMAEASFKHIKQEAHHPEYWDDTVIMNTSAGRDDPDVVSLVNISEMSIPAICEMVCDWVAMSQEVGGHPADWAQKNIGTRWAFTDEQEELIFLVIRMLWDTPDADEAELEARETVLKMVTEHPKLAWVPASELNSEQVK